MQIEYFKEYSECLNRDMEYQVYGYTGTPMLVFPSQDGRFFDFENNGMIATIENLIDQGKVQLFCCDSIDKESWSDQEGDGRHRTYMHEQWFYYIINELVPRIFEINAKGNKGKIADGIITTGCSMGGGHALNFLLRRPDIFKGTIALSGYYDSDLFFGQYSDDILYRNAPVQYLEGMSYDHPYVEQYRQSKIILCCGQGAWEDDMLRSIYKMKELFEYKDIPAWVDVWGYDVNHDWNWWQVQFPYFVEKIL